MKSQIRKLAIVCVTMMSIGGSSCHAGPILDWLFPNRAARREASNVGQLTLRVPLDGYRYNMTGYSPTTSYRSVWAPIPVTQYRPVSYVNPLSTGTQTTMLPCSTQQWQARRVPYTTYQPSSLFGGGSGWQSVGQAVPAASYPAVTAGYGSKVNYEQTTPWPAVTPSSVTANYGSASRIDNGWTIVGSGVSYAAPADGGTGLLSYGSVPTTVQRAGYPDAQSFSPNGIMPLPSSIEQSTWRPVASSEYEDFCQNDSSDYDSSLYGEDSPLGTQAAPWEPLDPASSDDRSRTQVAPADKSPTLPERTERRRIEPGLDSDPYDWKAIQNQEASPADDELTPERRQLEQDTNYRPQRTLGAQSRQVRPAMSRQDDSYYAPEASRAGYRDDAEGTAAKSAPYLKPIPDLNRNTRQPANPNLTDDADERTARSGRVAPDRQAVPIDWDLVDINRQDGLTRVKSPTTSVTRNLQAPEKELAPIQTDDEGGWRRVR